MLDSCSGICTVISGSGVAGGALTVSVGLGSSTATVAKSSGSAVGVEDAVGVGDGTRIGCVIDVVAVAWRRSIGVTVGEGVTVTVGVTVAVADTVGVTVAVAVSTLSGWLSIDRGGSSASFAVVISLRTVATAGWGVAAWGVVHAASNCCRRVICVWSSASRSVAGNPSLAMSIASQCVSTAVESVCTVITSGFASCANSCKRRSVWAVCQDTPSPAAVMRTPTSCSPLLLTG